MKFAHILALALVSTLAPLAKAEEVHLFILSGQSNMAGLDPNVSFTPTVTKALGEAKVIVVKDAQGGQPIRRWYKEWKPAQGDQPQATGDLYDRLLAQVKKNLGEQQPDTITLVWMQGERDAREGHGTVYAKSLVGLLDQLKADLGREEIYFVIGRLSDFDNPAYKQWDVVRQAQVEVGESGKQSAWVDTDDLNGPRDDLHYTKQGYAELGKRFADAALKLISSSKSPDSADE